MPTSSKSKTIAIIGAGPTALSAANVLAKSAYKIHVFDLMPSIARKFLRAGIGGLNITFDEPLEAFLKKYGPSRQNVEPWLKAFTPNDFINWVHSLNIQTFTGSSGRIFPQGKKAAPLLRAWLHQLRSSGIVFHCRHRWLGWDTTGALKFETPTGVTTFHSDATLLALGGASWPQLGSDGYWVNILSEKGITINPLQPANCGFKVHWSVFFKEYFAGTPIKNVAASIRSSDGNNYSKSGELMISTSGIEGGLIYALSSRARDEINQTGSATIYIDLNPNRSLQQLTQRLSEPMAKKSLATRLKQKAGIDGVKAALLREYPDHSEFKHAHSLAKLIKAFPLTLVEPNPIAEAISSAGGVCFSELDAQQMLKKIKSVFCAGEMLDWEAPTGGYLLSACFASGHATGQGMLRWLTSGSNFTVF